VLLPDLPDVLLQDLKGNPLFDVLNRKTSADQLED